MAIPLAVVGLGRRGRDWVRTIRAAPRYELVACVDADFQALREAATLLGIPEGQRYARLEAALDAARPRAVIVATSIDRHGEPCRIALDRGVAVLVEKPFTLGLREARQLVAVADAAHVPLMVGQNYRYMRMPRALQRLVAAGTLGRIGLVVCHTYRAQGEASRTLATLANSILWEIAVHHVDMLRCALGQEVAGVMAQRSTPPWSAAPLGASLQALLALEGGTRVAYTATYGSRGHEFFERGQEFYLRAVAERGTLHVFHRWLVWCPRGAYPRLLRRGPRPQSEERVLLDQLERALLGAEPECSGRDNLGTVAILEACARSIDEGRWIDPRELLREPL